MEKPDNLKNDSELRQIEGKIRKRLGIDKEDAKKDNFIFHYFIKHILLIIGFLVFCSALAYAIIVFAIYMTNMEISHMSDHGPYALSPDPFLTIAVAFFLFLVGMAIWYKLIKGFTNKN